MVEPGRNERNELNGDSQTATLQWQGVNWGSLHELVMHTKQELENIRLSSVGNIVLIAEAVTPLVKSLNEIVVNLQLGMLGRVSSRDSLVVGLIGQLNQSLGNLGDSLKPGGSAPTLDDIASQLVDGALNGEASFADRVEILKDCCAIARTIDVALRDLSKGTS